MMSREESDGGGVEVEADVEDTFLGEHHTRVMKK